MDRAVRDNVWLYIADLEVVGSALGRRPVCHSAVGDRVTFPSQKQPFGLVGYLNLLVVSVRSVDEGKAGLPVKVKGAALR